MIHHRKKILSQISMEPSPLKKKKTCPHWWRIHLHPFPQPKRTTSFWHLFFSPLSNKKGKFPSLQKHPADFGACIQQNQFQPVFWWFFWPILRNMTWETSSPRGTNFRSKGVGWESPTASVNLKLKLPSAPLHSICCWGKNTVKNPGKMSTDQKSLRDMNCIAECWLVAYHPRLHKHGCGSVF